MLTAVRQQSRCRFAIYFVLKVPVGNTTDPHSGLESGLAAMHLGHFALLKEMEADELLAAKPRVVMVSSAAMGLGGYVRALLYRHVARLFPSSSVSILIISSMHSFYSTIRLF